MMDETQRHADSKAAEELPNVARRWLQRSERGKGIALSGAQIDVLNSIGVGELISSKAAELQREVSRDRLKRSGPQGGDPPSNADETAKRAAEMFGGKGRRR